MVHSRPAFDFMSLPKPYYEDGLVTLYHADCLEILHQLEPMSVTLLWTDPPYGHGNMDGDLQSSRIAWKGTGQAAPIANDSPEAMRRVVDGALSQSVALLRADCCCCCCCCCGGGGPSPTFAWLAQRMDADGLKFFHAVVWDKSARGIGLGWRFRRDYEMVMVAHRKSGTLAWTSPDAVSNITRRPPVTQRRHPNEKPLALVSDFITWTTEPGDLVLDPFAGSGPALVAAKLLGRRAIGIELEERWCEIAAERLSQSCFTFENKNPGASENAGAIARIGMQTTTTNES